MTNALLAAGLSVLGAVLLLGVLWQSIAPKEDPRAFVREFVGRRVDFLVRLWRFAGPRLTHKPTLAMIVANGAILLGYSGGAVHLDQMTMILWIGANLLFPPWDDLGFDRVGPTTAEQAATYDPRGPGAQAGY